MYKLKEEYIDLFKEIKTKTYANYIGCDYGFLSSILNGNKGCKVYIAKAIIGTRFDITIRYIENNELVEKYFIKEK